MKMLYLKKSHPREFVVALHRVPKVVLQSPELSIQIVVNRDGAAENLKMGACKYSMLMYSFIS